MTYSLALESFEQSYPELEPLYREHYAEMQARLSSLGIEISPFNPRKAQYCAAGNAGWLLTFVVRHEGHPVGYSNVYVTNDMHNGDVIAQEDTVFVTKTHRNGIGRKLVKFVLSELASRKVKRLSVSAVTDTRAIPLWRRMGFKEAAVQMIYTFEGN